MSDLDITNVAEVGEREGEGGREGEQGLEQDDREAREAWFLRTRADDEGQVPEDLYLEASLSRRKLERAHREHLRASLERTHREQPPVPPGGMPGVANWTSIGPSAVPRGQASGRPTVSGRTSSIVVGANGSRVYVGTANGGIWRSTDAGLTWRPLDDYEVTPAPYSSALEADSLSVGAVAVKFGADPMGGNDTIFVGTGEPVGSGFRGIGVLSSNGGAVWTREATNLANQAIFKIVADPNTANRVLAATTNGIFNRSSAAAAANWTQVSVAGFFGGSACDLIVAGSGAAKRYYAAFWGDKVYRSANGTTGWTALTGLPAAPGRIALACGESDPSAVYALIENGSLYRLVGTAFQLVAGTPLGSDLVGTQGGYDLVVAVDPTNANVVYLAGSAVWGGSDYDLPLYRGTITGGSGTYSYGFNAANNGNPTADPTFVGRGVHPDAHAVAFALNSTGTAHVGSNVWVGCDGGVWNSSASGAAGTFTARNTGLAITQTTYLAQNPDTDAVVFTGSQDNGTVRYRGEQAWFESPEGDGGGIAIDPNNPYRIMRQYVRAGSWYPTTGPTAYSQFLNGLYTAIDGGQSDSSWGVVNFPPLSGGATVAQKQFVNQEDLATSFYAPISVSPTGVLPTLAAFGTDRLWLTADWGASWVTLPTATNPYTTAATQTAPLAQDRIDGNSVMAIAFVSGTRIFVATARTIWRYDKTGATWGSNVITTTGLPAGYYITGLAPDPSAPDAFFVCLGRSGYEHVWYFDGAAWRSAGLPQGTLDIPCHAIVVDPSGSHDVFLGSDVGVWKGSKSGTTWNWALFSLGLPEAAVLDLGVHDRARLLRASTHGRGVWEVPLGPPTPAPTDPDLYLRVNFADTGRLPAGARFPWVEGAADPTRVGAQVWHWMSADIKVRRPSLTNPDPLNSPPDYVDFAVNIDDYVDTSDTETADQTGLNHIFVQVHNRGWGATAVNGSQVKVWLLLTDAAAGLPPLPTNYAQHMQAGHAASDHSLPGDPPAGWLAASAWVAAEATAPFKAPPGMIDVRTPGIVDFTVDFAAALPSLPAGHDHVCASAFVTSSADPLTSTDPSLDNLTMHDKHVAHRNIHLVAAGARPAPPPATGFDHDPQTILIDLWQTKQGRGAKEPVELVLDRGDFTGHLSLILSKLDHSDELTLDGFLLEEHSGLDDALRSHVTRWLARAGEWVEEQGERLEQLAQRAAGEYLPRDDLERRIRKLEGLDRSRVYVASDASEATISGLHIPYGEHVTAAINIKAPRYAAPGDRFRFNVLQQRNGEVVGGSTYILAIGHVEPREDDG